MRKKVIFDIDGVLADFTREMRESILATKPASTVPGFFGLSGEPSTWMWTDWVTHEEFSRAWRHFKARQNPWETMTPTSGMADLRAAISGGLLERAELFFVTSRTETAGRPAADQTRLWLWNQLRQEFDDDHLVVVKHFPEKLRFAEGLDVEYSIDDHAPTVTMLTLHHKAFLMRQPWNRYEERAYDLKGVNSVKEYLTKAGL